MMVILVSVVLLVIWLDVALLATRSMGDVGGDTPPEAMPVPPRLITIVLALISLLIFERYWTFEGEGSLLQEKRVTSPGRNGQSLI